jgi:hypothetical protein
LKLSNIIFSTHTPILSQTPNSAKARQTKTSRPDNLADKCHFFFNLYYSQHHQRWFIPREGDGNCCHCGHIALAQDVVRLSTSNIDPTILKQVLSQLELNISPAAIRAMFNAETGHNLSHQQVSSLRRSVVIDGQGETPAERLLLYLKQSDDITFVALTARKEKGSLITIRISKKDRSSYNEIAMADNTTDQGDTLAGNPKTYAEQIMNALRLKDDDQLLLGVAWITKEG